MVKSFLYIAVSKYFNVIVEYLVVILTSRMLSLDDMGDFIMVTSSSIFLATLSGLSFDQFGAKEYYKNNLFNYYSYFKITLLLQIVILIIAFPVFIYIFNFTFFHYMIMFFLTIGILITKQFIVLYQINNLIIEYSKILIFSKFLLILTLSIISYFSPSLNNFLLSYTALYIIGLLIFNIRYRDFRLTNREINIKLTFENFNKNRLLYFTTVVTTLFYYLNYLLIYNYIDKVSLSYFHLAMQYNLAFVVLAQSFNIYFLSSKSRVSLSYFFNHIYKIYIFTIIIFIINLIVIYSPFFPIIIQIIFGNKYKESIDIFKYVILFLPSMLISMFFVSLWIVSNKYKLLFKTNLIGLILFFSSSILLINFYENTIYSVIYAMYISSIYGIFANHYLIYYYKRKIKCYQ